MLRTVRYAGPDPELPRNGEVAAWLGELDRTGRLVAAGPVEGPDGHLLIFRARDRPEAERVLRSDPFLGCEGERTLQFWQLGREGAGVSVVPAPARGAGRLTVLHRISVFVGDLAAARRWYVDVLGLSVRSEDPGTHYLELSLGPGAAGLVLVQPRSEWGPTHFDEGRRRVGTATGIAFRTDSVEALALRLRHAGSPPRDGPRDEPWGGRSLRFADPDGNEFAALEGGASRASAPPARSRRRHRRRPDGPSETDLYGGPLRPPGPR